MIGDQKSDLQAADTAGIRSMAVTYGFTPGHMLKRREDDYMIASIPALSDVLIPKPSVSVVIYDTQGRILTRKIDGTHDILCMNVLSDESEEHSYQKTAVEAWKTTFPHSVCSYIYAGEPYLFHAYAATWKVFPHLFIYQGGTIASPDDTAIYECKTREELHRLPVTPSLWTDLVNVQHPSQEETRRISTRHSGISLRLRR